MAHASQHLLEFGGSPVGTEFDGSLSFQRVDRIPLLRVSQLFTPHTARQIRYCLVATVGAERPFYHRYPYVALDVRMVQGWEEGTPEFVRSLRERLRELGGELALVVPPKPAANSAGEGTALEPDRGPLAPEIPAFTHPEDALAYLKELRRERRAAAIAAALGR
ncbi:MAG: hypothetical protein HY320_01515 [Armatimonadetes bacterium]|nr:hypothetical protein [Armatimonadota bacterium]